MTAADDTGDDAVFADLGRELADAIEASLPGWVERSVVNRAGPEAASVHSATVADAGRRAAADVGARLRQLLAQEIDRQWTNPLSIVRTATGYPTEILSEMGVPPVQRDHMAEAQAPDDIYDLTPLAFADFGPEAHERGIMWGAAKAHLHLQRRRSNPGESPTAETPLA